MASSAIPFSHLNLHLPLTRASFSRDDSLATTRCRFPSVTRSCLADASSALLQAAKHTVDTYIKNGMVIGLGSGHASERAIQYLGRQLRTGALKDIVGIPMSVASASEAAKVGIPLGHYQDCSQIDFAFDDADVIEEGTLIAIIGRQRLQGKESIIQEKSILKAADKLVFIIQEKQYKCGLEGSIPVLVQSSNWMETAEEIDDLFLGDAELSAFGLGRESFSFAGPLFSVVFLWWLGVR